MGTELNARPLLSDLESRQKFEAGDRILARVCCELTKDQYLKLVRAVIKFAGADVRVLIINRMKMKLILKRGDSVQVLVNPAYDDGKLMELGVANLDCSKVEMKQGDELIALIPKGRPKSRQKAIRQWLREWSGKDIEVRVVEGSFLK